MTIDYKHKFFIYHPDGKFTEAQIKEMLDAAYKAGKDEGYTEGYNAGKNSHWTISYPSPTYDWTKVTCTTPITTASTSISCNNSIGTETINKLNDTLEFRYNGTER